MFMAKNINSVRPIADNELKYLKYRNLLYVVSRITVNGYSIFIISKNIQKLSMKCDALTKFIHGLLIKSVKLQEIHIFRQLRKLTV